MGTDIVWSTLEEAREIIDVGTVLTAPEQAMPTYKSGDDPGEAGDSEIPAAVWDAGYAPPLPYVANTTRNLQFNQSHFIGSPGAPDGTTTYVATSDGYTWAAMSKAVNAMWPYTAADYTGLSAASTYYAGNLVTTPDPGVVKVTANFKAQDMKFWANEDGAAIAEDGAVALTRYFVTDQWGNEYVMHASGQTDQSQVAAAFDIAVLPAGWTKSIRVLTEDLILNPAEGSDGSYHYLVFRDSADNTYHQVSWSGRGSLAGQIDGMPVWGGQTGDLLTGDAGGTRADLMHGAGGRDRLDGGSGDDTLWGDADEDTISAGAGADLAYGNQAADLLSGGDGDDTLFGGQQADTLVGGAGSDRLDGGRDADLLSGGAGDDLLTGGEGADRFVLADGFGSDLVADFDGAGGDRVAIAAGINGTGIDSFAELQTAATATTTGVAIRLGDGQVLYLAGVAPQDLQADWFVFT